MRSLLIVEDSSIERRLVERVLEKQQLELAFAANGVEALAAVEAEAPDVVLTDLQMPEMDGLTLVRELRRLHPGIPVVLMTAHGSERIAAEALQSGAVGYVPKQSLLRDLPLALRAVAEVLAAQRGRDTVRTLLVASETRFVLGSDTGAVRALIGHLQEALRAVNFCDDAERAQIGTALVEAVTNAIEHGNLALDSACRDEPDPTYERLRAERARTAPYAARRVRVTARLTSEDVTYVVADEGAGFDPASLPDPREPANLLRAHGRGLLLIRAFMDEVAFNERGNEITMVKRRPAEPA